MPEPLGYVVQDEPRLIPDPRLWEQHRPGGAWYRIGAPGRTAYHIRTCERCSREALMEGKRRFCSRACSKRTDDPGYQARHHRVNSSRGSAIQYACADCGDPAKDWSQTHGTSGHEPEHYEPRCRKCHALYDLDTRFRRGEQHHNSKLTDAQRQAIRERPGASREDLATQFGVSVATIKKLRKGQRTSDA